MKKVYYFVSMTMMHQKIKDFTDSYQSCRQAPPPVLEGKYSLLTLKDTKSGYLESIEQFPKVNLDQKTVNTVQQNDVLVAIRSSVFYAIHINTKSPHLVAAPQFQVLRLKSEKIDSKYLTWFLNSSMGQKELQKRAQGSALRHLTTNDLNEVEIPVPDLKTQKLIVRFYELQMREEEIAKSLSEKKKVFYENIIQGAIQ